MRVAFWILKVWGRTPQARRIIALYRCWAMILPTVGGLGRPESPKCANPNVPIRRREDRGLDPLLHSVLELGIWFQDL